MIGPLVLTQDLSELSTNDKERHEQFVDHFGHFVFWLRNWSIRSSQRILDSPEAREAIGTARRKYYDTIAGMSANDQKAALCFAEDTLDGFLERFVTCLGDEGIDARFGTTHAYRFLIEMEIVDVDSEEIVHSEKINRGGKFFGSYWGRWLNRHRDK